MAIALILLVVAAHLGMWSRRMRLAQAAAGPATGGPPRPPAEDERQAKDDNPGRDKPASVSAVTPNESAEIAPAPARPSDRSAGWPPTGSLIDAKGPVADAAVLGAGGSSARPIPERAADAVSAPAAVGAARRARSATQDINPRMSQVKAKRSGWHSSGYRGRRRAD